MSQEDIIARLREKFAVLEAVLDERGRRLWAVTEARAIGYGGQTLVAQATGLSRRYHLKNSWLKTLALTDCHDKGKLA